MKPATAKTKGLETENKYVAWLKEKFNLPLVERRRLNGVNDKGDVAGWYKVCVEVKSGGTLSIPQWIREVKIETKNAEADIGFIAVRPSGKPNVDDWWAIMPMPEFMELMRKAGYVD